MDPSFGWRFKIFAISILVFAGVIAIVLVVSAML